MIRIKRFVRWALVALVLVAACVSWGVLLRHGLQVPLNVPQAPGAAASSVPEIYRSYHIERRKEKAFIGIAISGGGSRAANFAASVLSELDRMGILQRTTVISSVSGGSLAASYYVSRADLPLRKIDKNEFWKQIEESLSQDLRTLWLSKLARPDRLLRTAADGYSRTSVMADVMNELLLHGKPLLDKVHSDANSLTFSDLPKGAPLLLVNATAENDLAGVPARDCVNRGWRGQGLRLESVAFTNVFFEKCLHSDFGSYRLADAVMASASFPGIFNSVTLAAYPPENSSKPTQYLHLIDGGPSDNLGLEGIFGKAAEQLNARDDDARPECMIIAIDAYASGDPERRQWLRDVRGWSGRLIDPNFSDSIDAMLQRRRYDTLQRMGLTPRRLKNETHQGVSFAAVDGRPAQQLTAPFTHIKKSMSLFEMIGETMTEGPDGEDLIPNLSCLVWHIALDNVATQMLGQIMVNKEPQLVVGEYSDAAVRITDQQWLQRPEVSHRLGVAGITQRLRTDFNLSGPPSCSRQQLRDAIWEAGRLAVIEDLPARKEVCDWMQHKGWAGMYCMAPHPVSPQREVPHRYVAEPDGSSAFDCPKGG